MSNFTGLETVAPSGAGGSGHASAVSWGAIIAGAAASAAITLLLIMVTTGLGFAAVSPYPNAGVSATTFTLLTAAWLIGIHAIASSVGGYMSGRLRTRWTGLHTDEVYFRDTAHGFLTWATGILFGSLLLGSILSSVIGTSAQSAANMIGPAAGAAAQQSSASGSSAGSPMMLDRMFRSDRPSPDANDQNARTEIGRIMANAITTGALPQDDKVYVAQVIANRTGVSQQDAEKRIDDTLNSVKATADKARKGAMYAALWGVIALLIGAFCSSAFAGYAGGLRDN